MRFFLYLLNIIKVDVLFITLLLLSSHSFAQNNYSPTNLTLNYNQTVFDSDTCCWRKLSREKKYLDAANLIVVYLGTSKVSNKHSLNWHAGQLFAMANNNRLAKKYINKTFSVFYKWFGSEDAKTWYLYAKGTIAFLDRDKKKLEAIIKQWSDKFNTDKNYHSLVRLNQNWNLSYELVLAKN